ncbi:hypothetical protein CISIN_1g018771mg [Citrus sinensis]|uniref:Annexin n=1 Tax=Citrus sinensis TaxID=2711 RepID=A0A067GX16_CITSI|nr:hypothetical protein CISIN_1g018771mg [Citrus sinensis]
MSTLKVPDLVPPPEQDAKRLKEAFDGLGTDEKAVTWVLSQRTASQRQLIRQAYQRLYNESLIDNITSELSGDFKDAVIMWTLDPAERDAKMAKEALKKSKSGVKHLQVIVEISCASSPYHLAAVRQAYCALFDCSIEEDITAVVSMPLRKVLLRLVSSFRYDKELLDIEAAASEANQLHEAIKAKQLDHDQVVHILATRNFFQLKATFERYEQMHGSPIDEVLLLQLAVNNSSLLPLFFSHSLKQLDICFLLQDISSVGKGDLVSLMKMVILCIRCPERHFAEVIRTSIVGFGTDEAALNRAIITRAEVDMKLIKEVYPIMYKNTLEDDVIGDTSGDYQDFLLTLTGSKF